MEEWFKDRYPQDKLLAQEAGYFLAQIYSLRGEITTAVDYFEVFYEHNGGSQEFALYDPSFENIREDKRFQNIVKKSREEMTRVRARIDQIGNRK